MAQGSGRIALLGPVELDVDLGRPLPGPSRYRRAMSKGCPCGRGGAFGVLPYEGCCGRYLDDPTTPAPDAESLMRSRYTAFARGRRDYLLATWDEAHRPAHLDLDPRVTWLGLDVLGRSTAEDTAEVEFVARLRPAGRGAREQRLHERSRFARRDGRWYYVTGQQPGG